MVRQDKIIMKVLRGSSDNDISFEEICGLLKYLGFDCRIKGSHHIFTHSGIEEIINLQPKNSKTKQYQVKQVRNIMVKYKLCGDDNV